MGGTNVVLFLPQPFVAGTGGELQAFFFLDACPISATMGRHFTVSRSVIPQRHALLHPISPFAVVVRQNFLPSTFLLVSAPLPSASLTGDRPHSPDHFAHLLFGPGKKERKKPSREKNSLQAFSPTRPHKEQVRAPS